MKRRGEKLSYLCGGERGGDLLVKGCVCVLQLSNGGLHRFYSELVFD